MVPCDRILQTAVDEGADLIGLSGLITPSLDEMVFVAKEMEQRGIVLPLLIGGATTSRQHTAVKIAPQYRQSTVHVLDASRAVDVVSRLLSSTAKPEFDAENRRVQAELREKYARRLEQPLLSYAEACANALRFDWARFEAPVPSFTGTRVLDDVSLEEIVPFIDWTYFFSAWELKGRYPQILDHPAYGPAARELYGHAQVLLRRVIDERLVEVRGVYGLWPADAEDESVVLYGDDGRTREVARFPMLRQQGRSPDGRPTRSLADYVAPRAAGRGDYVGAFAVTAGLGAAELVAQFEADQDDYQAIMTKALADRLAEGFAEWLHARVRREWGYGAGEALSTSDLLAETIPWHPAGVRLSGLSRPRREGAAVRPVERRAGGHHADRVVRDDAGGQRERSLLQSRRGALLQRRPDRSRSGRGLRRPEADLRRGGRALAGSQPGV